MRRSLLSLLMCIGVGGLSGCSTVLENAPLNVPLGFIAPAAPGSPNVPAPSDSAAQAEPPRDLVGANVIALSLSGGGLRAAAFALGVLQALTAAGPQQLDVFDDLTFMSSVSGGSLTAAYISLHGRAGLARLETDVLRRNYEADLRLSLASPTNLLRLLAGGINDRTNLAAVLDREVFNSATFADLYRRGKPDVWINATDLYNRTPFPFIPPLFEHLCSGLGRLRVSEAVAASMAVPLAFAPVQLRAYPEACQRPLAAWVAAAADRDSGGSSANLVSATARAIRNYRDPERMRYIKLVDGGLTDNQGLASVLIAREISGTAYGPMTRNDAIRLRRMLFLVVDAGRAPSGDWALRAEGPSGFDVALASVDTAVDSATRFSVAAFRRMTEHWRDTLVQFRCSLSLEEVQAVLPPGEAWQCDDVRFYFDTVSGEGLGPERASRLREVPTRLSLTPRELGMATRFGHDAAQASPALQRFLAERLPRPAAPVAAALQSVPRGP